MLQFLDLGRPDVLAYRVTDILAEEDVRAATDAFDALLGRPTTIHLYAEVEGLRGFDARALWLDLVYGLRHLGALRQIGRVALVTDSGWIRRLARIEARLLPIGRLHVYEPDQRGDARAWVRDAPAEASSHTSSDARPEPDDPDLLWAAPGWLDDDWLAEGSPPERAAPERRPAAPTFGHTVHRTHVLLRHIARGLEIPGTIPAYHALRSVLHALRDRLPAPEAADLAAQLPTLVRGVFYEGYRPARQDEPADREAFLGAVAAGVRDGAPFTAEDAAHAVGEALAELVSEGEWTQVLRALPHDIRSVLEAPVGA